MSKTCIKCKLLKPQGTSGNIGGLRTAMMVLVRYVTENR